MWAHGMEQVSSTWSQGRKGFIEEMELELGTEVRGRKGVKRAFR